MCVCHVSLFLDWIFMVLGWYYLNPLGTIPLQRWRRQWQCLWNGSLATKPSFRLIFRASIQKAVPWTWWPYTSIWSHWSESNVSRRTTCPIANVLGNFKEQVIHLMWSRRMPMPISACRTWPKQWHARRSSSTQPRWSKVARDCSQSSGSEAWICFLHVHFAFLSRNNRSRVNITCFFEHVTYSAMSTSESCLVFKLKCRFILHVMHFIVSDMYTIDIITPDLRYNLLRFDNAFSFCAAQRSCGQSGQ